MHNCYSSQTLSLSEAVIVCLSVNPLCGDLPDLKAILTEESRRKICWVLKGPGDIFHRMDTPFICIGSATFICEYGPDNNIGHKRSYEKMMAMVSCFAGHDRLKISLQYSGQSMRSP